MEPFDHKQAERVINSVLHDLHAQSLTNKWRYLSHVSGIIQRVTDPIDRGMVQAYADWAAWRGARLAGDQDGALERLRAQVKTEIETENMQSRRAEMKIASAMAENARKADKAPSRRARKKLKQPRQAQINARLWVRMKKLERDMFNLRMNVDRLGKTVAGDVSDLMRTIAVEVQKALISAMRDERVRLAGVEEMERKKKEEYRKKMRAEGSGK